MNNELLAELTEQAMIMSGYIDLAMAIVQEQA
jgi:hypothetical protein